MPNGLYVLLLFQALTALSHLPLSLGQLSISWVTPTSGSMAGGTTVSIYGSGFSTDAYSAANQVFIGTIPCEVIDYTAASDRVECITSPYPDAADGSSSPSLPISVLVKGAYYTSQYSSFQYNWYNTPLMYSVTPTSGPLYSSIQLQGNSQYSYNYNRLFVGDGLCVTPGLNTNQLFGSTCQTTAAQVGGVNATAIVTGIGASWNHSQSLYPGPDWGLVMYEIYPDILSVYPNQGGSLGGTLLTIKGTGFGINPAAVEVDIDGIPCTIVSVSPTLVTCRTGMPPDGSPALASVNMSYPSVQKGYRFKGSRGVSIKWYLNSAPGSSLYSSTSIPNYYATYPSFESQPNSYNLYGAIYTAFFTPHNSGQHTFSIFSDGYGTVNLTANSNVTELGRVTNSSISKWQNFSTANVTPSELSASQSYLMSAVTSTSYPGYNMHVGVLIHDTSYTYSQTQQAQREVQTIQLSTSGLYNIQTLSLAVNPSQLGGQYPPALVVSWGERTSNPVLVSSLVQNGDALKSAIFDLFNGTCDFTPVDFYNGMAYGFEDGAVWQQWPGTSARAPVIADSETFCGRFSLYVPQGKALAFGNPIYSMISVQSYPYLCLAYKLPPGSPMSIAVLVQGYNNWQSINMIRSSGTFSSLANFQDYASSGPIMDDDQWNFACTDLGSMLNHALGTTTSGYTILGMGFYSDPDPAMRGFYVDEVSFSSSERMLSSYVPPARPNGIALHQLNTSYHSYTDSQGRLNITLNMEVVPASCENNIPLMNVSIITNETSDAIKDVFIRRTQVASTPLRGLYSLGFMGQQTDLLPYNSDEKTITAALQSLSTVGAVTVSPQTAPPPGDKLGLSCSGRTWTVTFEGNPGDLPLMAVDSTNLTGDGLTTAVKEIVTGGLFLRPIPGHMLQTVETTPQVHVRVNGQLAGCSGGKGQYERYQVFQDPCRFMYSASLNPSVTSITPTRGSAGTQIQIQIIRTGMNTTADGATVLFGSVPCKVTSVTYYIILCTLGDDYAGPKPLKVTLIPLGVADSHGIVLQYVLNITSVVPNNGSTAGGTTIAITGTGFAPMTTSGICTTRIFIGALHCDIISTTHSQVICSTPPNTAATLNVTVNVTCTNSTLSSVLPFGYTYDGNHTPTITRLSPSQGSGAGGDIVAIYGVGLIGSGTTSVLLGDAPCLVTYVNSTFISCVTSPHSNGTVNVSVTVGSVGRASGTISYSYLLQVTSISRCSGSVLGGQTLDINGAFFGMDPTAVTVTMGTIPCVVQKVTPIKITCTTSCPSQNYTINNNAFNSEYGLGYKWNPDYLVIHVGDTVQWWWTGSAFAATRNVAQVDNPGDTMYNGNGFRSAAAITGSFSQTFNTPGTYYYIAEGYADIGFNGTIVVLGWRSQSYAFNISINGVNINLSNQHILCDDTSSPYANYTFSVDKTPSVTVSASQGYAGMSVEISASLLSSVQGDNVMTFGGKPCTNPSSPVSSVLSTPAFVSVGTATRHYLPFVVFNCTLSNIDPGEYRVALHVEGMGWASASINSSIITVTAQVTMATLPPSGSLRGGLEISIPVHGLSDWVVGSTTVTIGSTPCLVQRVSTNGTLDGFLTCITGPAMDDGYSSVVTQDGALAYWSLQTYLFAPDGTYLASDGKNYFSSGGLLGSLANAYVVGNVSGQQKGISGNNVTDQAALFNSSYIKVPALSELTSNIGFGIELWLSSGAGNGTYRIIVDASSSAALRTSGYMVVLNPCNKLEFWLGIGTSTNSMSDDCPLLHTNQSCKGPCSGFTVVPDTLALPSGQWSVIQSSLSDWSGWHQVFIGWSTNNSGLGMSTGDQVLYVDGSLQHTAEVSYMPSANPITFGGSSHHPAVPSRLQNISVAPFVGLLDEISFYEVPLPPNTIAQHYHYGSTDNQPIWVMTESTGGVWNGSVPGVQQGVNQGYEYMLTINWETQSTGEYLINGSTALLFQWTGVHGLSEVTKETYESCDLRATPIQQWSGNQLGGAVTVELAEGSIHYFVDPVLTNCFLGHKAQVQVGNVLVIDWHVTTYNDITITEGIGVVFQWNGPNLHSVVEMASQSSVDSCMYVGPMAAPTGQVVNEWGPPSMYGNVAVIGLTQGEHYFVCSVLNHCSLGMRFTITVTPANGSVQDEATGSNQKYIIPWAIQPYSPITILEGESLVFTWNDFHSLYQVTRDVFSSCNVAAVPLVIWADPSVGSSVTISGLQPGTYYFICGVSSHCDAGMKVQVTVLPQNGTPLIPRPSLAQCDIIGGCQFSYSTKQTPVLLGVVPSNAFPGSTLTLNGVGLVPDGTPLNTAVTSTIVWIGNAPCSPVTLHSTSGADQTLTCTTANYESGVYYVDVFVAGKGLASVSPTALTPGPLRNTILPANITSLYPVLFLMATASTITPSSGSIAGGTPVLIGGSGFSYDPRRLSVSIGGSQCTITSSSVSTIACITGPIGGVGNKTYPLSITVNGIRVNSTVTYSYLSNQTAYISSISPSTNLTRGTIIQINGTNFDYNASNIQIYVLTQASSPLNVTLAVGNLCPVMLSMPSMLTCKAPLLATGSYEVVVYILSRGLSIELIPGASAVSYQLAISGFSPQSVGNGGGINMTINGTGFPASLSDALACGVSILVCSTPCLVVQSSVNIITCTLGPNNVSSPLTTDSSCFVKVTVGKQTAYSTSTFSFLGILTPVVYSISPSIGGTAGGTIVTIEGKGLLPPGEATLGISDIVVTIGGSLCQWFEGGLVPTNVSITCRTSAHPGTTGNASVAVMVRGKGQAVYSNGTLLYKYYDRWSSNFTWGGASPPGEGDSVYIRPGQTVVLDTSTPVLNLILIEGFLIFDDSQDIHLQAKYIFINGGGLQVGTEQSPFLHNAIITLSGIVTDSEIPIYGAKVLGLRQGTLDLHGIPRRITWTRLAQTVVKGSDTISLQEAVDWVPGDIVVIAATGKNISETEVQTIVEVSPDGLRLTFNQTLQYLHQGITEVFEDGQYIDIRAEVGLLTHNVVVEGTRLGDPAGFNGIGADQYGSQVFIHRSGMADLPVRIEHVEFRYGGQAYRDGRYPVHFYLCGSMNGSYIKHCAIHHSYNRAIAAHGVNNLLIQGNVAYDVMGHTYFIEDGVETNNSFIGNLGVLTRGSSSLLNTDQAPAIFWITNPQNVYIGNAAAASMAYGFWYSLQYAPTGASYTPSNTICPYYMPLGGFANNTAHTCGEYGLEINYYIPYVDGRYGSIPYNATLYSFTTYSNGGGGVQLSYISHITLSGFKVADNLGYGIQIVYIYGDWGQGAMIKNSLVVSHTSANAGSPGLYGIYTPSSPYLIISNVTFANFNTTFSFCLIPAYWNGYQVWFNEIKFLGGSQHWITYFQTEHEVLYWDMDGTLTGYPGGWATPNSGLHPFQYCNETVPAFSHGPYPGAVCTSHVHFLTMYLYNWWFYLNITNSFGSSLISSSYTYTLPSGYNYTFICVPNWWWGGGPSPEMSSYYASIYGLNPKDRIWITHHLAVLPDHVEIGRYWWPQDDDQIIDIGRFPQAQDPLYAWHITVGNMTSSVTYLISGVNQTKNYSDLSYSYSYQMCPRTGCPVYVPPTAPPLESDKIRWSSISSWPSGRLPAAGEDVNISAQWNMLMDVPNPPPLGTVFIMGHLQFEDVRDYNFTAKRIVVLGFNAELTIGTQETPFQNSIQITLTGHWLDAPLILNSQIKIWSKEIAVFGNVSIFGQPSTMTWTHLGTSAHRGDSQITLQGNTFPNWNIGNQIVIAPSGWEPAESEIRTVTGYNPITGVLTLNQPLLYDHLIYNFLTPSDLTSGGNTSYPWWGGGGLIAPEVGLLTHNVVIQGGGDPTEPLETSYHGCYLYVGTYYDGVTTFSGLVQLDSVEFRFCGQGGYFTPNDPRYSITFRNNFDNSVGSFIRGCSIHHGYNTAIGIHTSNGVQVMQNVIWRTKDSSLKVGGIGNNITGNLAIYTTSPLPNQPNYNYANFPATFDIDGGNVVRDNAAGGSTGVSYRYPGDSCIGNQSPVTYSSASFWNNTAHTGLVGMTILGTSSPCTSVGGFTSAFHWSYGIYSSVASSLVVTNVKIATGKVGMNLNVYGPDPVQHLIGHKFVQISNSLIVGNLPGELCYSSTPSYAGAYSNSYEPKLGVMMSSFNQYSTLTGYPVIDGVLRMTDNTFARFFNICTYGTYAIGNNPNSPDAVHPVNIIRTVKLNVQLSSLVYFYDPNPAWVNPFKCVDMDCDGPKHALIRDLDGSFVGTYPVEGSVVPFAEIRFNNYINRLPVTWLAYEGNGQSLATPQQVVQYKGVARGNASDFNSTFGGCTFMPSWNAYRCQRLQHFMFVFESMDADTETRRLSPIALHGGNTGAGNYTDMINGPMNHPWCKNYACFRRLSTFFTIVAKGTDYYIWPTGSPPKRIRFHLLNASPQDSIRLDIWFKDPLRKDVYKNGIFIEPSNVQYLPNGGTQTLTGNYIPPLTAFSGAHYYDRLSKILHMIISGSDPIEIRTAPVIQVSLTLAVSIDQFFTQNLISNLAYVLNINPSSIRVVNIIAESATVTGKRSLLAANDSSTLTLELGAPPPNVTDVPAVPSVEEQIDQSGGLSSVDMTTNLPSGIPSSISINVSQNSAPDFIQQYNASVLAFNSQVDQYNTQLHAVVEVYNLGEQLVNLIQTGQLPGNVTQGAAILNFSVFVVALPTPPVLPEVPLEYQNLTSIETPPAVLQSVPPTLSFQPGQSIPYTIPAQLVVTKEPSAETGHLVYVVLVLEDSLRNAVTNLGLTTTWNCTASLHHTDAISAPVLEGITTVPLVAGKANFTKLRVNVPANGLTLSFVVQNFEVTASVKFSVVSPPASTARRHVSFILTGDTSQISQLLSTVNVTIAFALCNQMNIDISRLLDVSVTAVTDGLMVSMDILDRQPTDPPTELGLLDAIDVLSNSNITVAIGSTVFTLDQSTLSIESPTAMPPTAATIPGDYTLAIVLVASFCGVIVLAVALLIWVRHLKPKGNKRRVAPTALDNHNAGNDGFILSPTAFWTTSQRHDGRKVTLKDIATLSKTSVMQDPSMKW